MGYFWDNFLKFLRGTGPEATVPRPEGLDQARLLLRALTEQSQVPGLAVRVQYAGDWILEVANGYSDLEQRLPVTPVSRFRVASVSKPITAVALARLVAAGSLRLDDPLVQYVPEYPDHGIRLWHLASHMAGLRGYRGKEYALNRPLSIEGSLELFRDDPLLFEPGAGFRYNSFDFVLLSLAMQRAAGVPFQQLVRQQVLGPLGMDATTPEDPSSPPAGMTRPYTRQGKGFRAAIPVDNRFKLAGGGYVSSVRDVCRLGQSCLDGNFIPAEIQREFLTGREVDGAPTWYGLGWQVSRDAAGRPFYGHIGNGIGGYSNFFVYPERNLVLAILVNCTDPGVQPVLDAVVEAVHGAVDPA